MKEAMWLLAINSTSVSVVECQLHESYTTFIQCTLELIKPLVRFVWYFFSVGIDGGVHLVLVYKFA